MTDAILLFTFSPVQSFIAEARRAADLYTGSQILVELAKSAAGSIGKERLIYPALDENGNLPADIPNKLVAQVPFEECEAIAENARQALFVRWREIVGEARAAYLQKTNLLFEEDIWQRQSADDYLWETYWTAAQLDGRKYEEAYIEAEAGLVATKFTRPFSQYEEPGFKDTLSGKRQALRSKEKDGRQYWYVVGNVNAIVPIQIRPSVGESEENGRPRERLDVIGVVKRFHPKLSEKGIPPFSGFPSTSSIASLDYLESVRKHIADYRVALASLFGSRETLMRVRKTDPDFLYDGDFLYMETLTKKRLMEDYRIEETSIAANLEKAKQELRKIKGAPSPYYAIIVLDGDGMGEHLRTLNEQGHRDFSKHLYEFSKDVSALIGQRGCVVYNGGDDVLALAPLAYALPLAADLAYAFCKKTGRTASAGIAIAHHLSPLGSALEAARRAEHTAKSVKDKNAVCVLALKRSGDPIEVISRWDALQKGEEKAGLFGEAVREFKGEDLSSKLPYDLFQSAYAIPKADSMLEAELGRLVKRHLENGTGEAGKKKAAELTAALFNWAVSLPEIANLNISQHLAQWLALARFVAKGGEA